MTNDQTRQAPGRDAATEPKPHVEEAMDIQANVVIEEMEEWEMTSTDQRRPQFRSAENYGRRAVRK